MRRHWIALSFAIALSAIALPISAAEIEAASRIDGVTVYPDGATITRVIRLDLPAGDTTLLARDFPTTLDPSSLRIEGEANARLVIGSVDARTPRPAPPANLPEHRQAHRNAARPARGAGRRDRRRDRAPQVRRTLRRGVARRNR